MKKSVKGFTLVEIMIVVAIIGIIIAIAVPAFLRARENSRATACQENLSKIDGSKEQYALEFKLPNAATIDTDGFNNMIGPQGYLKKSPECPSGGEYTWAAVGTDPTCSIANGAANGSYQAKHAIDANTETVTDPT